MRIILASGSPRRRELLEQIGLEFEILVSNVEEEADLKSPEKLVETNSRQKAEAVLSAVSSREEILVIGADTVVARRGIVLGKPSDKKTAARMLEKLSGRTHQVYTGVTVLHCPEGTDEPSKIQRKTFSQVTKVKLFPMARDEIVKYVATGDPLDKAGAYGIQGIFARYVERMEGDYNNVVGLPVGRLYQEIKEWLV